MAILKSFRVAFLFNTIGLEKEFLKSFLEEGRKERGKKLPVEY
jgi:hypothetical protein